MYERKRKKKAKIIKKKKVLSSMYNKDDIPRELQRLIDHTDRGIEQLYRLAGTNSTLMGRDGRRDRGWSSARTHAWRDLYDCAPAQMSPSSSLPPHRRHHANIKQQAASFPTDESGSGEEEEAEEEEPYDSDAGERRARDETHKREVSQRARGSRYSSRQRTTGRTRASMGHPLHSSQQQLKQRANDTDDVPPHTTVAFTPNRTLNYSSGTLFSSPASLKKPPYTPQPDLPSPSSFLSFSQPNLSNNSGLRQPPWRQRQQQHQQEDSRLREAARIKGDVSMEGEDDHYPPARSAAERAKTTESPLSTSSWPANDRAAYRAHLAAQQSTQKPDAVSSVAAAAARRERRTHRSLLLADDEEEREASASHPELTTLDEALSHRHTSGLHETSSASASAGMLSRFGRRWGAVFEEMLAAPPPPPSLATRSSSKKAGEPAATATQPAPSSSSSTSHDNEAVEDKKRPYSNQNEASHTAALPTSGSLQSAAEALAARHRTSPHASARPSADTSGVLVPAAASSPALPTVHADINASSASSRAALSATATTDARLIENLRTELRARDEATLQLRIDHAREMAELRQSFTLERATAAKHTADELATTYGIQQQLLQSSLQTERERVAEAEEQLRLTRREAAQRKLDCEDATHALTTLQKKYATLASAQQELVAQLTQCRTQAEKATAASRQLEAQEKVWRAKEVDWQAREGQLQQRVDAAEERLRQQEASAQDALAQVEAEFTQTSQSYQDLLAEATKRMSYLEKSHRKYKVLKESHNLLKSEHAELVESTVQRARRHESEVASLRAEVQELRQQLHQRDAASQEASESYQETLRDYKRRLELQEATAAERAKTLQQHVDTANHTIELLRTQLEGARQELVEEQSRGQQQQMEAAQAELQAKEALAEQQRSAAAYKVRSEEVIAQQRRQLREKDAKMQALAAGAAEPVQRLREQLDDERGRRARLEEQLKTYKRKAKEAEEHAAAEIRREQLRNALLLTPATTAQASASMPQRLLRSATATPSAHSSSTPRPSLSVGVAGVGGWNSSGGGGGAAASGVASRATTAAVVRGTTPQAGRDLSRRQHARQRQLQPPSERDDVRTSHRRTTAANAAVEGVQVDAPRSTTSFTPPPPPPPATCSQQERLAKPLKEPARTRHGKDEDAAAVDVADLSAVLPNATVQSLSGISRSSPCTSTLLGEADLERATVTAVDVRSSQPSSSRPMKRNDDAVDEEEESESDDEEMYDAAAYGVTWYAQDGQRRDYTDKEDMDAGNKKADCTAACHSDVQATASVSSSPARQDDTAVASMTVTTATASAPTQVYVDAGLQEHEERMKTFHASALEVMRRFAGSRQEALARCADLVKQTAAERCRNAQAARPRENGRRSGSAAAGAATCGGAVAAPAVTTETSESDSDSPRET